MAKILNIDGAKLAGSDVYNTTFGVPVNYGMIAGNFSANTVQDLIDNVRYKGACCGSAAFKSDTHINNAWYCFIWIPHTVGGQAGGDTVNFGVLLLFPMNFASEYGYVVRYAYSASYHRFPLTKF